MPRQHLINYNTSGNTPPLASTFEKGEILVQHNANEAALFTRKGDGVAKFIDETAINSKFTGYTPTSGFSTINGSAITTGDDITIEGGGIAIPVYYNTRYGFYNVITDLTYNDILTAIEEGKPAVLLYYEMTGDTEGTLIDVFPLKEINYEIYENDVLVGTGILFSKDFITYGVYTDRDSDISKFKTENFAIYDNSGLAVFHEKHDYYPPGFVNAVIPYNNMYPSAGAVYSFVRPTVQTAQPSGGMLPNVLYKLGTLTGSVTISFATPTDTAIENEYKFTFTAGSTAPTITWPSSIAKWAGNCIEEGAPTITEGNYYEVSVLDGVAFIIEIAEA